MPSCFLCSVQVFAVGSDTVGTPSAMCLFQLHTHGSVAGFRSERTMGALANSLERLL